MRLGVFAITMLVFNLSALRADEGRFRAGDVGLGDDFLCALSQGKVQCWSDKPPRTLKVPDFGVVTKLAVGPEGSCVITEGKVACWNIEHPETLLPGPEVKDPIEVLAGKKYACATTASELLCWWTKEDKTLEVHREDIASLKSPKLFLSWYDEVRIPYDSGVLLNVRYESRPCLVDDKSAFCLRVAGYREGYNPFLPPRPAFNPKSDTDTEYRFGADEHVKYGAFACDRHGEKVSCWKGVAPGPKNMVKVPTLKNPRALATNTAYACALDDNGISCWNERGGAVESPFNEIPLDLISDHLRMCAVYPDRISCTGILSHGQEHYWKSDKLISMTVHPWQVCAMDRKEARCWGTSTKAGNLFPTTLENPIELTSSGLFGAYTCARQTGGLNCWGWTKAQNELFVKYPPELGTLVRTVGGTTSGYCAVFSKVGMRCLSWTGEGWDNENYTSYSFPDANFQELTEVAHSEMPCALFGTKLVCRKYSGVADGYKDVALPGVTKVKHIAAGSNDALYVLDDEGLKRFAMRYEVPRLEALTKVPADAVISSKWENGVCYSSESTSQAACIPDRPASAYPAFSHGEDRVPPLKSPRAIEVSGYFQKTSTCALDREGFKCWGRIFTSRTYQ